MSGPGDTATKSLTSREVEHPMGRQPTQFPNAEGHAQQSEKVDLDCLHPPWSESSARSQIAPARKPGDLGSTRSSLVDDEQPTEQAEAEITEKSDEDVVPKKSTKTRVMPVESMEGRSKAKEKSTAKAALPAQDGTDALAFLQRIRERAKESQKSSSTTYSNRFALR